MTIDEAIEYHKRLEEENLNRIGTWDKEYSNKCKKWANEHRQIAKWLEELKEYKATLLTPQMIESLKKSETQAHKIAIQNAMLAEDSYNKAIDDFIHECDKYCGFYSCKNKNLTRNDILKIAEQLKEKKYD